MVDVHLRETTLDIYTRTQRADVLLADTVVLIYQKRTRVTVEALLRQRQDHKEWIS